MTRLAAIILALSAAVYLAGQRADRALTKPGESALHGHTTRAEIGLVSPGFASVSVRYRGRTAREWAMKYKRRTSQYQDVRASIRAIVLGGYGHDWRERAFLCIHSHEGAWNDPNPPFWGGLQMDMSFQRSYGGWALRAFGTADKWPVSVQLAVAIQASLSRGFWPWPNTARMCGLL